jgi:hypothetical protein
MNEVVSEHSPGAEELVAIPPGQLGVFACDCRTRDPCQRQRMSAVSCTVLYLGLGTRS